MADSLPSLPPVNHAERPLLSRNRSDSAWSPSDTRAGAEEVDHDTRAQYNSPVDICNEIGKILEANPVGLNRESNYVPRKELDALLQIDAIKQALGRPCDHKLAEYIRDKAQRTFATLLVVFRHSSLHRIQAMRAFKKAGFTDKLLSWETFARCKDDCDAVINTCHHYFPSPMPWSSLDLIDFDQFRWQFLVPDFDYKTFQYDFHHQQILPWKSKVATISAGLGTFSEVTCIKMIAGHQNLLPAREDGTVYVAHKRLKAMDDVKGYNIDQEWRREAKAHSELNGRSEHLVRGIAAYQLINKDTEYNTYHILLEWADGGSLNSFWKANPAPQLSEDATSSRERVKSLLKQIKGLTEALECMHFGAPSSRRSSVQNRPKGLPQSAPKVTNDDQMTPSISIQDTDNGAQSSAISDEADNSDTPETDGIRLAVPKSLVRRDSLSDNWRHGDIKPDNILRFEGEDDLAWLGTLKLADLGRAQLHQLNTAQRSTIERERWRTRWYEPPDLSTDLHQLAGGKISRLFDIWSMGCVIFESVVWMLYGWNAVGEFQGADSTDHEQFDTTPYWTKIAPGRYSMTTKAAVWIDHVLVDTQRYSGALRDLMQLVKDKLLIVRLPPDSEQHTPGYRTNAREMVLDLSRILEKAEKDSSYLFSGTQQYQARAPPKEDVNANQSLPDKASSLLSPASALRQPKRSMASQPHEPVAPQQKSPNLLLPNSAALSEKPRASHATRIARDMVYTDDINDEWQYLEDQAFAEKWISQNEIPDEDEDLCPYCRRIDLMSEELVISRANIEDNQGCCTLCELMDKATNTAGVGQLEEIRLVKALDVFVFRAPGQADVHVLRLCCMDRSNKSATLPLGAPRLSEPGRVATATDALMKLAKAWLDECESQHSGTCDTRRDRSQLPKRLLDVRTKVPKIVDSASLRTETEGLRYVAFSHKWGDMPEKAKTTKANLHSRRTRISPAEIPASFADAVAITKALGCKYLWIDCLCINQGPDGDFAEQAGSMQTVFSNAYCVVAAASAPGATSGFWARNSDGAPPDPVRKGDVFISAITNDFTRDVLQSPLNQRGWVLQEHALARRTLFFTNNQMYWECGDGIRCETLRKLRHDVAGLLGDADFPSKTIQVRSTRGTQIHLWTRLFEQYSALAFSYPEDRSVAIEGLIARLTTAFRTRSLHGVFDSFWGRCLLWRRPHNGTSLKRIRPGEHAKKVPPTWSWMAVEGAIDFLEPEGGEVEWNSNVILPFGAETNGINESTGPNRAEHTRSSLLLPTAQPQRSANGTANGTVRGDAVQATAYSLTAVAQSLDGQSVHYDNQVQRADGQVKAVIICTSKDKKDHHVLLVSSTSARQTYERAGVACMSDACIDRMSGIRVSII